MHRVDETALPCLHGLLDELEDCVDCVVLFVKDLGHRSGTFSSF